MQVRRTPSRPQPRRPRRPARRRPSTTAKRDARSTTGCRSTGAPLSARRHRSATKRSSRLWRQGLSGARLHERRLGYIFGGGAEEIPAGSESGAVRKARFAVADRARAWDQSTTRLARSAAVEAAKPVTIGVPKEIKDHETRVGLVPSGVTALREAGHRGAGRNRAGEGSSITDEEYAQAGADDRRDTPPRSGARPTWSSRSRSRSRPNTRSSAPA